MPKTFDDLSVTFDSLLTTFDAFDTNPPSQNTSNTFFIDLYDEHGDLSYKFDKNAICNWEYNRKGGCGQLDLVAIVSVNSIESKLTPKSSIKVFINNQLRYSGKLIKVTKQMKSGMEMIALTFYGYVNDLAGIIVRNVYLNQEVSEIVKDILQNYVIPNSDIIFNADSIQATDYVVASLDLNHTAQDALVLLSQLGGDIEWGVDRNKVFYFQNTDPNVKRVYIIGREVTEFTEERSDENIKNILNVFGANGFLAQVRSSMSVGIFGSKEDNLFESSITENSDANRLGAIVLKSKSNFQRSFKFSVKKSDEFIEQTTPLGATALNLNILESQHQYATFKYGQNFKYGNLRRDQLQNIRYQMTGGGFDIVMTLTDDIPSLANDQKRVDFELKDLQRR